MNKMTFIICVFVGQRKSDVQCGSCLFHNKMKTWNQAGKCEHINPTIKSLKDLACYSLSNMRKLKMYSLKFRGKDLDHKN